MCIRDRLYEAAAAEMSEQEADEGEEVVDADFEVVDADEDDES